MMKKAISVTIEESLYNHLKKLAVADGRNLSNLIEFLLRKAVEDRKI